MAEDLSIKIGADSSAVVSSLASIATSLEQLQAKLNETASTGKEVEAGLGLEKIGELSGEVFDKLKEKLTEAIAAYGQEEDASKRLAATLQNQGIYSDDLVNSYNEYAESVSHLTGIQEAEITKAQAVAQGFLGQVPVTEDLTQAIADLSVQQGVSMPQAAAELGKAVGEGTGQLLRMGLQFTSTDTEADRLQKTLDFVKLKAGGMAEEANTGIGSIKGLQNAFDEANVALGEKFAPAVEYVVKTLTDFITPSEDSSEELENFKAAMLVATLAVTGLGVAVPIVGQVLIAARAALAAFNLELETTKIVIGGIVFTVIIAALTEMYLHWQTIGPAIMAVVQTMADGIGKLFGWLRDTIVSVIQPVIDFVSNAFTGLKTFIMPVIQNIVDFVVAGFKALGGVIAAAFNIDVNKIKQNLDAVKKTFDTHLAQNNASVLAAQKKSHQEQDKNKADFASKETAQKNAHDALLLQLQKAQNALMQAELDGASDAEINLKKQQIEILKELTNKKNGEDKALLEQRLAENIQAQKDHDVQEAEQQKTLDELEIDTQKEFGARKQQIDSTQGADETNAHLARIKTKEDIQSDAYNKELDRQIDANNKFLEEQNRYGTIYASINKMMHSAIYEGTDKATGELAQLTQSKNKELKAIGQAASVAQIIIKAGESAMNVYAGFSAIPPPFIGIPLGIAGATAALAFGYEQVRNVMSAADGGVITGGVAGQDSVPAMLMPGELVVPAKNFEETVTSIAQSRITQSSGAATAGTKLQIGFSGPEASRVLTMRQNEDKALGIYRGVT